MPDPAGASRLTHLLLEPADHTDDLLGAVRSIPKTLAALAVPGRGGSPSRLTDHDIRSALASDRPAATGTPFAWSARTARRALGLDALRSLLSGETKTPTHAVRAVMARMGLVRAGERPTSSMEVWLAGLPAGSRSAVEAEAVTWATRLWNALDWRAFPEPPVIGRDHWWDSPHTSLLALRSRSEVRALVPGAQPASVHLVVLGGTRRPTVRAELCVVALVEALRAGRSPWPGSRRGLVARLRPYRPRGGGPRRPGRRGGGGRPHARNGGSRARMDGGASAAA